MKAVIVRYLSYLRRIIILSCLCGTLFLLSCSYSPTTGNRNRFSLHMPAVVALRAKVLKKGIPDTCALNTTMRSKGVDREGSQTERGWNEVLQFDGSQVRRNLSPVSSHWRRSSSCRFVSPPSSGGIVPEGVDGGITRSMQEVNQHAEFVVGHLHQTPSQNGIQRAW